LIKADARSSASLGLDTAASPAAISAASDHPFSNPAIPGKAQKRKRSFFKLSRRRPWATSCAIAVRNSDSVKTAAAPSDISTLDFRMPAAVRAGTTLPVRNTGTLAPVAARVASLDQSATTFVVLT